MHLAIVLLAAMASSAAAQVQIAGQQRNDGGGGRRGGNTGGQGQTEGNNNGTSDPQSSLTLDPSQVQKGLANDGQAQPTEGQAASLTSVNNFMNFCMTRPELALTDGKQIVGGSCNPTPMGIIVAQNKMPSAKFQSPKNLQVLPPNQDFDIVLKIKNMQLGAFVNPQTNYYGAPGQTNANGIAIGHSHFTVEKLSSLDSTEILDNTKPAFFKGINGAADVQGNVRTTVTGGLPEGDYRLTSINTYSNHQPILAAVANRGSLDDTIYFSVKAIADQNPTAGAGGGNAQPSSTQAQTIVQEESSGQQSQTAGQPTDGGQQGTSEASQPISQSTAAEQQATGGQASPPQSTGQSGNGKGDQRDGQQRDGRRGDRDRFGSGRRRQREGGFQRSQRRVHIKNGGH